MSPRAAIEKTAALFGVGAIVSSGFIRFQSLGSGAALTLTHDDISPRESEELVTLTRA